ncbi:MAG: ATP-binding cassette domain-containing protein, partial [Alicyclobacillaceae bacterium]|nr:ATP-binding cassette domain-containing protein [Alicyclobacillaceae bacterium]
MSVEIENLTVETDSGFCLRIPYLSVEKGGIRAIAGPSGSGKSLLFETVAGFHRPLSGCIRIGGREVTGQPAERRKVAMIFQEDALFPHLTVLQNVSFAVGRDGRARQWLARAGMEEYGALYPSQLNAYERRRVDFLRALVADAEVILMDEPTAGLPPERKEAWRQFAWEWLKETGRTALVATADVEEAVGWSQQMAVLWNGRLIQEGTAAELFQRPLTPEVVAVTGGGRVFRG